MPLAVTCQLNVWHRVQLRRKHMLHLRHLLIMSRLLQKLEKPSIAVAQTTFLLIYSFQFQVCFSTDRAFVSPHTGNVHV